MKGAYDWNGGLFGACEGGNKEVIELMIEKGANNWNEGLFGACEGGNKEVIELNEISFLFQINAYEDFLSSHFLEAPFTDCFFDSQVFTHSYLLLCFPHVNAQ